ncbi:hypothetical protein Ancab_005261 [Ancistrocladus abbreviatus]
MENSSSSIQALVSRIKERVTHLINGNNSNNYIGVQSFVSPSAYDTAWLAMVADPRQPGKPMFKACLDWVLDNQNPSGFWGETDREGFPTIDSLPATLACMIALKTWNLGHQHIQKGMAFISANAAIILKGYGNFPRWFSIIFPGMIELAKKAGMEVAFLHEIDQINDIFDERSKILQREQIIDKYEHPPLLSYLEALPSWYCSFDEESIISSLNADGPVFQSPSAAAHAFIATRHGRCLAYLQTVVQTCKSGAVPPMYPVDEDFIKICTVDQLQRLGLSGYFNEEIKQLLEQVYRNYKNQQPTKLNIVPANLFRDSLAFRLLRMQGYHVSPWRFCWFLSDGTALAHINNNLQKFSSVLYSIYRATDLMFQGEVELQDARLLSRKLLKEYLTLGSTDDDILMWPNLRNMIEYELDTPWMARMDHLDHRKWIEESKVSSLYLGKASFYRLSFLCSTDLMQLAEEHFQFLQSTYKRELEELTRWSKALGLIDMGFAREKTAYCYFASASSIPSSYNCDVRLIVAKSATLITVADDFFDMEGVLDELKYLTTAVQRWDGRGLIGHSKIIFNALDNFVRDIAMKYLAQQGSDITYNLQQLWYEAFDSWLKEATWSKTGHIPSMASYLEEGMISIAVHVLVLQAACFVEPSLPASELNSSKRAMITKYLMISARLLNDLQSYKKEERDGKKNSILLYLEENPDAKIEESIAYVESILDQTKKKLLEHALMDGLDGMSNACKQLHLSILKAFEMFFNSANHFDSSTAMLDAIKKAIYIPPEDRASKPLKPIA